MAAKFGTSGLRGLVEELTDGTAARFTAAFARHMLACGAVKPGATVYIGEDMRGSSPLIARQCHAALQALGLRSVSCGVLPTPALALHAMTRNAVAVMITGSHIPADRNGLKYYSPDGEIDKADETAITQGAAIAAVSGEAEPNGIETAQAIDAYLKRYAGAMPADALKGKRIGVYQHSTTARDVLVTLLERFGAEVLPLGRSEQFIPVDTEAVSDAMRRQLRVWAGEHRLDAIASADGDGDRPLLTDERGECLRGDALGLITARTLGADAVVTPVTSNSGIEAHVAGRVFRTRVGSPFVIAAMAAAVAGGASGVLGFEANGGALTATPFRLGSATLSALPTRDSALPILACLAAAGSAGQSLSGLVQSLALPVAASGRIEHFPTERSQALVQWLSSDAAARTAFLKPVGKIAGIDLTDGLRMTFADGRILHLRPSGNAPEMRCYTEGRSEDEAATLVDQSVALIKEWAALPV